MFRNWGSGACTEVIQDVLEKTIEKLWNVATPTPHYDRDVEK
jgi:hypothetical protein